MDTTEPAPEGQNAPNVVEKAIAAANGLQTLAEACGVKYQAVQKWRRQGKVPAERVLAVEEATGGKVSRHELRPDIYPESRVA